MKTTIHCPDIECDSCVHVIGKVLGRLDGMKAHEVRDARIEVEFDDKKLDEQRILEAIRGKGYRASTEEFEHKTLAERWRDFKENKKKYAIERQLLRYTGLSLLAFMLLEAIVTLVMEQLRPGFAAAYAWWLFYLALSVGTIAGAIWHLKAYRGKMTCMTGMMVGMTIGMQIGMMVGIVIGATNGYFIGAMTGMIIGSLAGAYAGSGCGTMGWSQGLMAGVMGGTMGPMIALMMFSDHLLWFMPFFMVFNLAILAGFSIMLYEEVVEGKQVERTPAPFGKYLLASGLALAALTAVVLFAPPSIFLR